MRRRSTFVHDATVDVNPERIHVDGDRLQFYGLDAAREERLTFGHQELPQELWQVLKHSHELHIRWASENAFNTTTPFHSRISPGLHVFYTPLRQPDNNLLCSILRKLFSTDLACDPPSETFIKPSVVSERFASGSTYQFHALLPSLRDLVTYLQRKICTESDLICLHSAALLNLADSVDLDYDTISHALTLTVFWSKPPTVYYDPIRETTTYNAWDIDIRSSKQDRVEVGILSSSKATDPFDLQLSGFLTVLGEHDHPKPTLFSFPSRHQSLNPSQSKNQKYTVSFQNPTGLHPIMQISFSSARDLLWPENHPAPSTCALQTYLTLPSYIFADVYAFSGDNRLFQETHKVGVMHSVAGETDLEAPDYVLSKWGSTALLSLGIPEGDKTTTTTTIPPRPWNVTIPLHLRYLPPSTDGKTTVQVPWPVVFWACTADDGTKFPVNPFDRTQLGFEAMYGPRTVFYHLDPAAPVIPLGNIHPPPPVSGVPDALKDGLVVRQRLVETLTVPVLNSGRVGAQTVEWGTVAVIVLGFLWVFSKLVPALTGGGAVEGKQRKPAKKTQ